MKILMLLDRKYPTDHVFLETVYTKIFPQKGHEVVWVMKSNFVKEPEIKNFNGTKVYTIPVSKNFFKEYAFEIFRLGFLKKLLKEEKFDIIQVRNEPIMGLYASYLSRKFKIPFVFQLSHLKAEETILFAKEGLYGNKYRNYAIALVNLILRTGVLKRADLIFPVSEYMGEYLEKEGIETEMIPMPLGIDPFIDWDNIKTEELEQELGTKGRPVLIYIGTFSKMRHLEILMESIKLVKIKFNDVLLLMVGKDLKGGELDFLKNKIKECGIEENVKFTGYVDRKDVPAYLKLAHVGISPIPFNKVFEKSSPTKLMEYMDAGLPVVGSVLQEQEKIIKESGCGFCVKYTAEAFSDAIRMLLSQPEEAKKMGELGRGYIRKHRDLRIFADQIEQIYRGLIK